MDLRQTVLLEDVSYSAGEDSPEAVNELSRKQVANT